MLEAGDPRDRINTSCNSAGNFPTLACPVLRGEKTFCASFRSSLIASSRRAFLCVDCVCLLLEFWVKCTRCERFTLCKAFLFDIFSFFSSLENYFGFRTTNVKGKTDHSVSLRWNKRFWTFLTRRVFFWLCIRLIYELISFSPGWIIKPACILLLVVTVTFFTCPDLLPLQNQLFLCLQSKNYIAVITHNLCAY